MASAVALIPRQGVLTQTGASGAAAYQAHYAAPSMFQPRMPDKSRSKSQGKSWGYAESKPAPNRAARPREERLMMQVMLDDVFLAAFRRALFSASEGLITLLRVQPDPRDAHRVKVWLGLNRPSVRAVIDLIIATLPEAEIGRIAPA